jgi:hypothetical protein
LGHQIWLLAEAAAYRLKHYKQYWDYSRQQLSLLFKKKILHKPHILIHLLSCSCGNGAILPQHPSLFNGLGGFYLYFFPLHFLQISSTGKTAGEKTLVYTGIFIRHFRSGAQYVISTQFHVYALQRLTSLITDFLFRYHTEITESHSGILLVPEIVENPTSAVLQM